MDQWTVWLAIRCEAPIGVELVEVPRCDHKALPLKSLRGGTAEWEGGGQAPQVYVCTADDHYFIVDCNDKEERRMNHVFKAFSSWGQDTSAKKAAQEWLRVVVK
jgi:hypothetical protein